MPTNQSQKLVIGFCLVLSIFLLTRFINLTSLPVFTDEASYWNSARLVTVNFLNFWDNSLILPVAKPPLFIWLSSLAMVAGVKGIWAVRLISVFGGLLSILAIYFLTKILFSEKEAKIASFLYILLPFGLFYDRLGIMETLLVAFLTLSYFFFLVCLKTNSLAALLASGLTLGFSVLTKQSGQIGYLVIIILAVLWTIIHQFKFKNLVNVTSKLIGIFIVSFLIANIVRLSDKYQEFTAFTPASITNWSPENLTLALQSTIFNITAASSWLKSWLTVPLFWLFVLGAIVLVLIHKKKSLLILTMLGIPILFQTALASDLFPRYFLMVFPQILIIIAFFLILIWEKLKPASDLLKITFLLITFLLFLPSLIFSYQIIFNPAKTPLHYNEKWQYISGWPSGFGVKQASEFLKQNKTDSVKILIDGHNGHLKDSLALYGVDISLMDVSERDEFEKAVDLRKYTLIVANRSLDFKISGYEKVAAFAKPDKEAGIIIFQKI